MTQIGEITLDGFQGGRKGFVLYGLYPDPIDYLYLRVRAGRQSGKTFSGAVRAALYMDHYPGSQGMIVGLNTDKVRDTILPTLYRVMNLLGCKYGEDYEYNKTERMFTNLRTNSVVFMRSAEEPQTLPGPSLAWFWLDEDRKMPEDVFLLLQPTLTQIGYPHHAWLTSTPAGRAHWTRKIWHPQTYADEYGVEVPPRLAGTYVDYRAYTRDNKHLSPEYYKTLASTYGEDTALARQELFGEEVILEGLVFPVWSPQKHILEPALWPKQPKKILAGVDFGFSNPCAILVVGIDEDGRHYIIDEFYRAGMSEVQLCEVANGLRRQYDIRYFVCDSADPRWVQAMRSRGLPAMAARKTVGSTADPSSGVGLCHSALARTMSDGSSFTYVSPKCVNFRREIENYVMEDPGSNKNPNEKPRKHADHLMDAWRYAEIAIERFWGNSGISRPRQASLVLA